MPLSRGVSRTNVAYRQTWIDDDLWKVTIGPSSKASSSNGTTTLSARTFSVKSERGSKRNLYIASDENERENRSTYRDDENAEIASLSSAYHKLNRSVNSDCFRTRSFNSDNRNSIPVLSGRERDDRADGEKSEGIERSRMRADTNYSSNVVVLPLVELGAVCKILDFMANSNPEVSSVTNSCCNEISRTLRCLFARVRDKKPEDLLLKDSSLYKCERCGVISCSLKSHEEIKGNGTRAEVVTTVSDSGRNNERNNEEESEIPTNHFSDLKNDVQSRIFADRSKANCRTENKDESSGTESSPIKERTFVTSSCIESRNGVGNISDAKPNAGDTIGTKSYFNNIIKRLFENNKAEKDEERKYDDECTARNNRPDEYKFRVAMKARPDIGREEVVRKISYELKSQIDASLVGDWRGSRGARSIRRPALNRMRDDIYSMADTVKYLTRGRLTSPDKKEDDGFLSKLRERRCTRLAQNATREQSSVLYTSRDDRPQRDSGFWLFDDESRRLSEVANKYRCSLISRLDSNRKIAKVAASTLRRSDATERTKKTRSDCAEKDSLEDCTLLEQRKESGTTTFSSSSAENLIHEWMGSPDRKDEISDVDIPRGRRLVSSKPSLDIARHVRDEIAKERISDGAKKSTRRPSESNVLARLSSETRRRICRLIEDLLLNSPKDLTICLEKKRSTSDGGELPRGSALSATVALVPDNYFTTDNEITNICADDCAPSELSAPTKSKNCSLGDRDNFEKTSGRNSDRSEDSVKIFRKNTTVRAFSDKPGKMGGLANDSARKIARQIIYKNVSSRNHLSDNDEENIADVRRIYWRILENSSNMDWDGFRELVETLHPRQRELWRDICRTIDEEANRASVDGNTEVCIEISPVDREESPETSGVMARTWEIVFELDMTLKDVEGFLNKRLRPAEERLDTHKDADEDIASRNDGGRGTTISKRAS